MKYGLKTNVVLSVVRGSNQRWHVTAQDMRESLASFDDAQAACAWAIAQARPVQGRVLVEEIVNSAPYSPADSKTGSAFKYSIPVTWADDGGLRRPAGRSGLEQDGRKLGRPRGAPSRPG